MPVGLNTNSIGKENRNLLGLAVKCLLISVEQEKQILSRLIEKLNKDSEGSVVQIFREDNYLSEEDIDFLFAIKKHLKLKMLDKKFGELGVANKFINPENVKKALNLQSEIFRETQKSKLIGDILLEQKKITKANKASILLTQDRVKDELLAEAINDIASTEMEKISINMRFGAIAVKKGIISINQLNQALKVQEDEVRAHKPKRYFGEILKELFGLSDKDLIHILKIQKEFEKQRLSLEKTLSRYNLETTTNKRLSKLFEYRFSKNKLEAHIQIVNEILEEILASDVLNWLKSIGINFGICDEKFIEDFLASGTIGLEIKIAKGYAPTAPVNESIEFLFDIHSHDSSNGADTHGSSFVKKGDVLARIIPHKEGKSGKDVCGFHIPPSEHKIIPLGSGKGVVKKGNVFLADTDGNPTLFKNRTLFVTSRDKTYLTKYFSGHIKTDLGTQYQSTNLKVDGNIDKGGRVICHDLTVTGDMKGQIRTTGAVRINGNVGSNSDTTGPPHIISADKDIVINKNIANAVITTSKMLKAPNSDLISSEICAFQDILLKNIYSKKDKPTILQIGKRPGLKVNAIDQSIDEKKQALRKLLHEDELEEIKNWFNGKIQMQNDYLEQQNILKHLLKLMSDKSFENFEPLEQKITSFESRSTDSTNYDNPDILKTTHLKQFINELLNDTRKLTLEKQKNYFQEMADVKFGMYRAAVNATQRYKNEYNAQQDFIMQKIKKLNPEITKKKQGIDDLYIKKDFIKLSEAQLRPSVNPTIRVKNKVEKGTVIKGRKSVMVIDQNMYGVKFTEKQKSDADTPQITIEGIYD